MWVLGSSWWGRNQLSYVARVICLVLKFSELFSSFFLIFWVIAYVWLPLLAYDRLTGVWRVELSGVMSANHLHQQYKASSHFDHIPFIPSFYALVPILKHCMIRKCLTCGFWEVVDEVEPIVMHSNLGSYFYVMLILLCYARRRGLVWENSWQMWELLFNG